MNNFNKFPEININNIISEKGNYKKNIILGKGFLITNEKGIFLPLKDKKCSKSVFQNGKIKKNGYILEIIFHGLNYSAKRLKLYRKNFLVDLHKSEIFICKESQKTEVKSRIYKRRLVFFSYEKTNINNIENYIKVLKKPNSYTGKGLFSRNDLYNTKKVQKRK
jgi:hypothetical protein